MSRQLQIGDRVRVFGGYDAEPLWLRASQRGYEGSVVGFLANQIHREGVEPTAAVVELDKTLVLRSPDDPNKGNIRGVFLVLTHGSLYNDWSTSYPRLHVQLCDALPEGSWVPGFEGGTVGWWVESHASYEFLEPSR